jgi:hypothetical protein
MANVSFFGEERSFVLVHWAWFCNTMLKVL